MSRWPNEYPDAPGFKAAGLPDVYLGPPGSYQGFLDDEFLAPIQEANA
jgi:hypothetical protein